MNPPSNHVGRNTRNGWGKILYEVERVISKLFPGGPKIGWALMPGWGKLGMAMVKVVVGR